MGADEGDINTNIFTNAPVQIFDTVQLKLQGIK